MDGDPDLAAVIKTGNPLSFGLGLCQCRQKHRREDGNDGNDHQQFDQREPFSDFCAPTLIRNVHIALLIGLQGDPSAKFGLLQAKKPEKL
jgi:hypothetical protein